MTAPEASPEYDPPDTTSERVPVVALAYELIPGDLIVDTWEDTSREVAGVDVGAREVTVRFTEGEPETSTQRPGSQRIYDVQRLRSALPEPQISTWSTGGPQVGTDPA